jgi:TolB protein
VNKEQRIPDISYFSSKPDPASTMQNIVLHGQEFHTSFWGHMGIIGLKENYLIPDYAAYPNTPAASLYPTNAAVADLAHSQGAVVGYVHPFDTEPDPSKDTRMVERELPVDVALGKIDYYETIGFSDHRATAAVWYRLLNCGFHLPAGAGSDTMANYASLRGPVGITRVYVNTAGSRDPARFLAGLREGNSFVTNGPLIGFTLMGRQPGAELKLPAGKNNARFTAFLRSIVPIDHLEIVSNGKVVKELKIAKNGTFAEVKDTLTLDQSGWYVLRAWNDQAIYPVLDVYPYATTSPIYVTVDEAPVRSSKDADYFIMWIDKVFEEAKNHSGYNTEEEKSETLKTLKQARNVFQQRRKD